MSEPFDLEQLPQPQKQGPSGNVWWRKVKEAWEMVWRQSVVVSRRGETVIQLPLPIAALVVIAFPHASVLALIVGVVAGYSISVVRR